MIEQDPLAEGASAARADRKAAASREALCLARGIEEAHEFARQGRLRDHGWPGFAPGPDGVRIIWPRRIIEGYETCVCSPVFRWMVATLRERARRAGLPARAE